MTPARAGTRVTHQFHDVYVQARAAGDFAAIKALDHIGKFLGIYERDRRQRRQYTEADAERIRAELKMRGMTFERKNWPAG